VFPICREARHDAKQKVKEMDLQPADGRQLSRYHRDNRELTQLLDLAGTIVFRILPTTVSNPN